MEKAAERGREEEERKEGGGEREIAREWRGAEDEARWVSVS